MFRLQKQYLGEYQVNMFAPDLHSFTTEIDHSTLYGQTVHNLKVFVAAGMPIKHSDFYLYRQSFIPAHSELTVILNNFAYFGELSRMTQFKENLKMQTVYRLDCLIIRYSWRQIYCYTERHGYPSAMIKGSISNYPRYCLATQQ